jgi:hypothetical protein
MDYKALEQKIINSYVEGVTASQAENIAGEFIEAQIKASEELKEESLRHRLLKADLKEISARLFYNEATKGDKKPSDSLLQSIVDKDPEVKEATQQYILAEEKANELFRLIDIFKQAHYHFEKISNGKFD